MNQLERLWKRYWFEFALPAGKVNLLRFLFFGVLALDLFLQLEHAPRYGAGDFNVGQLSWLEAVLPDPGRLLMVVLYLTGAYLAARAALGVAVRQAAIPLALIYGYSYFSSQLDAYQHHYLVFLLLVISCFIPWDQARELAARARAEQTDEEPEVISWALRLFVVQLAVVYFWAAVTKMSDPWTDGRALQAQLQVGWVGDLVESVFGEASQVDPGGYKYAARLIMLAELVLAAGLLWRKAWAFMWPLGVGFHIGVELAGFEIGLFSYFMFGIYVLFVPDIVICAVTRVWRGVTRGVAGMLAGVAERPTVVAIWLALGAALVAGIAMMAPLPFEAVGYAALLIAATAIYAIARQPSTPASRLRLAAGHVLACTLIIGFHLTTEQAFDYYRFLGGTSRRLGDTETMQLAYEKLTRVRPGYGPAYYHLGNLARQRGERDLALDLYRRAQLRQPPDPRPFVQAANLARADDDELSALGTLSTCQREIADRAECHAAEAAIHRSAGRRTEALAAAGRALEIDPRNRTALAVRAWAQPEK